jgi:hypothetical protein
MVLSDREKKDRRNAAARAKYHADSVARERKNAAARAKYHADSVERERKKATARDKYHADSVARERKKATSRAWKAENYEYRAEYRRRPETKVKIKKNRNDYVERYFEKHGHFPDSSWSRMQENRLLLKSNFVRSIASREKIFPDGNEFKNVVIRDETAARFVEEAGLELTPKDKLDQNDKNVKALLSLVDGCKVVNPEEVAFLALDTEFYIPKDGTIVTSCDEAAVGAYNSQGVRIKHLSIKKESGVVDKKDWDDMRTFIVKYGTGKPLFCWGNAELVLFKHLGLHHGVNAVMVLRRAFPDLINEMRSQGIGRDPKKLFSMSMDVMTPVFGMGDARHEALEDCDGEAVIIAAFGRNIAAKW